MLSDALQAEEALDDISPALEVEGRVGRALFDAETPVLVVNPRDAAGTVRGNRTAGGVRGRQEGRAGRDRYRGWAGHAAAGARAHSPGHLVANEVHDVEHAQQQIPLA